MLNQESVTRRNVHFVPLKSKTKSPSVSHKLLLSMFGNVHAYVKEKVPALIGNTINILQEIKKKPAGKKKPSDSEYFLKPFYLIKNSTQCKFRKQICISL